MNPLKCNEEDYINFVIAAPKQLTAAVAEPVQPAGTNAPAHEVLRNFWRGLNRMPKHFGQIQKHRLIQDRGFSFWTNRGLINRFQKHPIWFTGTIRANTKKFLGD